MLIPSVSSSTIRTSAPRLRRFSSVRSYVGDSTTTASPALTMSWNRNASACIEPLVTSTWSTSTSCTPAMYSRRGT